MVEKLKTRAGILPATSNEVPFTISTDDAAAYISNRIMRVINKINDEERTNAAKEGRKPRVLEIPEMALATRPFSKKFAPMEIAFSMNALTRGSNHNTPSIFNPDPDDNSVKLRPEIYAVVGPYMYNNDDQKAFFSNQMKHTLEITTNAAHEIKAARRITVTEEKDQGRKVKFVSCLIDPLRLFHDMLSDLDNAKERFDIRISEFEKINDLNFKYKVTRKSRKNGGGHEKTAIAKYLAKSIHK